MNFSQQLAQKLDNVEQAKEFAKSSYTQRIHKIMPFKGAQDSDALLPFMGSVIVICLLGPLVHYLFGSFAVMCFAGFMLGFSVMFTVFCSGVVPYFVNKWKGKAQKLGLETPYGAERSLSGFTAPMHATSQLEVIKRCEEAGATPQQIQTLYQLALENLPYAWWSDLLSSAIAHCTENRRNKDQKAQLQAAERAEQLANEEIRRNAQNLVWCELTTKNTDFPKEKERLMSPSRSITL